MSIISNAMLDIAADFRQAPHFHPGRADDGVCQGYDLPPSSMLVSDAPQPMLDAVISLLRLLDMPRDIAVPARLIKK